MMRLSLKRRGFVTSRSIAYMIVPLLAALLAIVAAGVLWRLDSAGPGVEIHIPRSTLVRENAPMCPWRDPTGDLRRYFSGATGYTTEIWILSGQRLNLSRRLGRQPTAEENRMYLYRVYAGARCLGTVSTRRVHGEFGGIEVMVAVDRDGRTLGVRIQRSRERPATEALFTSTAWLKLFCGRTASDIDLANYDLKKAPPDTRVSAAAVQDGVRSMLIEMAIAGESGLKQKE